MALDTKQKNTLAAGAMGLALAFGFYFFIAKKRNATATLVEADVETLQAKVEKLNSDMKRYGGDLSKQLAIYDQHMQRLEQLIPQRSGVPDLINSIAREAQVANVAYGGITPKLSEPVAYYSRETFDVQVSGSYHEIGAYMAGIASLNRIVKPMDLKLNVNATAKPRPDGVPVLDAKFSIETYVIPAPGELAADSLRKKKGK